MIQIQNATRKDIQDLLELLNTTNNIEIQAKIFSLLACYLVSDNNINGDLIITSHFVYDRVYTILSQGPPKKITVTLNFISALLYDVEEDFCSTKQSLVLHAQLMLRVSGCLALMSNLFNSCMVHQETWSALCRCLAEVCRQSKENQNYCSDLITTGIRRCSSGDTECYQVLQSLLYKHDQNTQQFVDSNGLAILTRDKLHNISCLKLINAISQNAKAVIMLVHKTEVVGILKNFLELYEKDSQIGQWATIVLYNIKTLMKDIDTNETEVHKSNGDFRSPVDNLLNINNRFAEDFHKEQKGTKTNMNYKFCINNENISYNHTNHGDTTELFQNVFREILQGQKDGLNNVHNIASEGSRSGDARQNAEKYRSTTIGLKSANIHSISYIKKQFVEMPSNDMLHRNIPVITPNKNNLNVSISSRGDLSFSFLLNENYNLNKNKKSRNCQQFGVARFNKTGNEKSTVVSNMSVNVRRDIKGNNSEVTKNSYNVTKLIEDMEENENRTIEFKPTIVSTPKRFPTKQRQFRNYTIGIKKEERSNRHDRYKHQRATIKEMKNKSFSGKFFGAINESCTMLVKTVKNIFTTRNTDTRTKVEQSTMVNPCRRNAHSNCSFMDYMRRRDAIMGSQSGDRNSEKGSGSCETCNDTILLKQKLEKDQKLKQTLKKLKFGINLYGCDFKKISASMWPHNSYMTPTVLYNLYRKLIVK
ncbi:uncharacterized protein LOC128670282 [Plodia interpunctella]|uniref:uncharacterized protein LOC128670282 n=1 Tax=Plodia interpunctella TaxID=58824 RepID=UPI002368DA8C|nr:uncharacterized protein LOC128670282 [Plodia interpunctella]